MRAIIDFKDISNVIPLPKDSRTEPIKQLVNRSQAKQTQQCITLEENLRILKECYPEKILFSIDEAASILNVSYEFVRERVAKCFIPSTQLGDRRMINLHVLANLLTRGVT